MDPKEWMTTLPGKLREMSIINLAIPGSHNSMTYGINSKSGIAPDAEDIVRKIGGLLHFFVRRWAKTQEVDVTKQLELGVRYLDLRVAQKDNELYYVHGLFANGLKEPLEQVKAFLDQHLGEVVILDFQHFYAMHVHHHMELHAFLLDFFGTRIYSPRDSSLKECTLNKCRALGRQVLIIYRRCPLQLPPEFWSSNYFPTPWPNVTSAHKLELFLNEAIKSRNANYGYISQCIITPSNRYILLRCLSSLHSTASHVCSKIMPWIEDQSPGFSNVDGHPNCNIFMADFVNLRGGYFCRQVIRLNYKLYTIQEVIASETNIKTDSIGITPYGSNATNLKISDSNDTRAINLTTDDMGLEPELLNISTDDISIGNNDIKEAKA